MNLLKSCACATSLTSIIVSGLLLASSSFAADSNDFLSKDVFELEYASDPQVSPNGKRVAYVRRSNDIMTDNTRSNIGLPMPTVLLIGRYFLAKITSLHRAGLQMEPALLTFQI
jgi:hypothetical protein